MEEKPADRVKVRFNVTAGEYEIEGPDALVKTYVDRFDILLTSLAKQGGFATPPPKAPQKQGQTLKTISGVIPDTFGEYLHNFPTTKRGTDRMLIAGHFVQSKSTDNTFTTADANKLLKEQSIRLGNPSQTVNDLLDAKRIFVVSTGNFRVSETGLEYLEKLKGGGATEGGNQ